MILQLFLLLLGFCALYFGADWMVRGAARLQGSLGLSPIVIGLTVVSLGTSAPELVVALLATLQGSGDLAVGNVLGSNLANMGLILGATALVRPFSVVERVVKREVPIMILFVLVLLPLMWDGVVGRGEGLFLASLLGVYLTYVFHRGRKAPGALISDFTQIAEEVRIKKGKAAVLDIGLLVVGGVGLVIGGKAIVESATYLARALEVSELVIGLTVVAIGTSLPELATSLLAALRNQTDIAVGNVIGSNIFNITGVLGVASAVKPIPVAPSVLGTEFPAVLALSFLMLLIPIFPLAKGNYRIPRWKGALLLGVYLGLLLWIL